MYKIVNKAPLKNSTMHTLASQIWIRRDSVVRRRHVSTVLYYVCCIHYIQYTYIKTLTAYEITEYQIIHAWLSSFYKRIIDSSLRIFLNCISLFCLSFHSNKNDKNKRNTSVWQRICALSLGEKTLFNRGVKFLRFDFKSVEVNAIS